MPRCLPTRPDNLLSKPDFLVGRMIVESLNQKLLQKLCIAGKQDISRAGELLEILTAAFSEASYSYPRKLSKDEVLNAIRPVLKAAEKMRDALSTLDNIYDAKDESNSLLRKMIHNSVVEIRKNEGLETSYLKSPEMKKKISSADTIYDYEIFGFYENPFQLTHIDVEILERTITSIEKMVDSSEYKTPPKQRNKRDDRASEYVWAAANAYYWFTGEIPKTSVSTNPISDHYCKLNGNSAEFIKILCAALRIKQKEKTLQTYLNSQDNKAWS